MYCVCKLAVNGRLFVLPIDKLIDRDLIDDPNLEGKLVKKTNKSYYGKVLKVFVNQIRAVEFVDKINNEVEEDLQGLMVSEKVNSYNNNNSPRQMKYEDFQDLFLDIKAIKSSLAIIEGDQANIKKSVSELKRAVYEEGFAGDNSRRGNSVLPHEVVESALLSEGDSTLDCHLNTKEENEDQSIQNDDILNEVKEFICNSMESNGFGQDILENGGDENEGSMLDHDSNRQLHYLTSNNNTLHLLSGEQRTTDEIFTFELPPPAFRDRPEQELIDATISASYAPTYSKAIRRLMDSIVPSKIEPGPLRNELVAYLDRFVQHYFHIALAEPQIRGIVREKFKDRVKSLKLYNKAKKTDTPASENLSLNESTASPAMPDTESDKNGKIESCVEDVSEVEPSSKRIKLEEESSDSSNNIFKAESV